MASMNQKKRSGPGPKDHEVHARICQLKIATSPHPSKILQRGGNVFPRVSKAGDIDIEIKLTASDESE